MGRVGALSLEPTKRYPVSTQAASGFVASNKAEIPTCCFSGLGVLDFAIPPVVQEVLRFVPDNVQLNEAVTCVMKSIAQNLHSTAKISETQGQRSVDICAGVSLAEYFSSREASTESSIIIFEVCVWQPLWRIHARSSLCADSLRNRRDFIVIYLRGTVFFSNFKKMGTPSCIATCQNFLRSSLFAFLTQSELLLSRTLSRSYTMQAFSPLSFL